MRQAVFIDRDGTLNEMVYDETHGVLDSPRRPEQVRAVRGAALFLGELKALGFLRVVVTNQPGIAKGTLSEADLAAVNTTLADILQPDGWDELRYCPHHEKGARREYALICDCRKPLPGLLIQAAKDLQIDLARSWMVGDGLTDVQAGRAAGCRTILVTRLKIEQVELFFRLENGRPDFIAADLGQALEIIRREMTKE